MIEGHSGGLKRPENLDRRIRPLRLELLRVDHLLKNSHGLGAPERAGYRIEAGQFCQCLSEMLNSLEFAA